MPDLSLHGSRRKQLTGAEAGGSFQEGRASVVSTAIALVLIIVLAAYLIAPRQVDGALDRTVSAVTDKNAVTTQVWRSVASTLASEDAEPEQIASASPLSSATVLKPNESITTGYASRTVLTRGHDILELGPQTTIAVGGREPQSSTTIIRLIDGTVHVRAAKRTDGGTLSVETQALVATVKGTKFDVTITEKGTAVSVTEGIVSIRSTGSSDGVDLTRGRTAVVSAAVGATPRVVSTPAGGTLAAIEAVSAGTVSNGNHHQR